MSELCHVMMLEGNFLKAGFRGKGHCRKWVGTSDKFNISVMERMEQAECEQVLHHFMA